MCLARIVLFLAQFGHMGQFFSDNEAYAYFAASTAAHFVASNALHAAFVLLFCRSFFYSAEVILILNFVNLSALYFRQGPHARPVQHLPSSAHLAWTFVSIYWNLAIALVHHGVDAKIFGLVFIWSPLFYGLFAFIAYKVKALDELQAQISAYGSGRDPNYVSCGPDCGDGNRSAVDESQPRSSGSALSRDWAVDCVMFARRYRQQ